MKPTTVSAYFRIEYTLENAPVTPVSFSHDASFIPTNCVICIDMDSSGPTSARINLAGGRTKKDGTPGKAPTTSLFSWDDGELFPDPPDYVRELFQAALEMADVRQVQS